MPEAHDQQIDLLRGAVVASFRGDWRDATLTLDGGLSGSREIVDIGFCLRRVTDSIRMQSVWADVQGASDEIARAEATLGRYAWLHHSDESPRTSRVGHLLWTVDKLVRRERADLNAVRLHVVDLRDRGEPELVLAWVEHLTWIEFDPFTVSVHPSDQELTGLDDKAYARWRTGNRLDICARATRLRQFAAVYGGSVSERTWPRAGGYPKLREQALRALAAEPETRGRPDLPIRLGRRRAWRYARDWLHDTAA